MKKLKVLLVLLSLTSMSSYALSESAALGCFQAAMDSGEITEADHLKEAGQAVLFRQNVSESTFSAYKETLKSVTSNAKNCEELLNKNKETVRLEREINKKINELLNL